MQQITDFFNDFQILIGSFTAVVLGLFAFWQKIKANFPKNLIQNDMHEIKALLEVQNARIEQLENLFFVFEQQMKLINAYVKEKNLFTKLKTEIEKRKTYYITEIPGLDNSIQSLIIEGCDKSYYFFKTIRENGYNNINSELVTKTAIQIFRTLRSGEGGNINIDTNFKEHVKNNIAMPAIFELNVRLNKLKSGVFDGSEADVKAGIYNGGSDKELINIAIWFIDDVISKSVQIFNKK